MKTSNKILVYDDHCPLCVWYTGLFVKYGLLSAENRIAFSGAPESLLSQIDFDKGKNEIPLIDAGNGEVVYGLDALLSILGQNFPLLKRLVLVKPFYWFFKKLYKLISFNRKVVVAIKCGKGEIDCSPEFSLKYRLLFILFSLLLALSLLPAAYNAVLPVLSVSTISTKQLLLAALLLASINYFLSFCFPREKRFEYLGQHAMMSLLFLLAMAPLMIAGRFIQAPSIVLIPYLSLVAIFLTKEYIRRMRFVGRPANRPLTFVLNMGSSLVFACYLFNPLNS
jgi:predicted DCC family thiol-disulfide oxidoreductase YuxK